MRAVNNEYGQSKICQFDFGYKRWHFITNMGEEQIRYKKNIWAEEREFQNLKEQEDFLLGEAFWKKLSKRENSLGVKTRYYCNQVSKHKSGRCPAEIYIQELNDSVVNKLFRNGEEHAHEGKVATRTPIEPATREKIYTKWSTNTPPRLISHQLRGDADVRIKPSINQVIKRMFK